MLGIEFIFVKGMNSTGDDLSVATSLGITFYTLMGIILCSAGDNLPKSTGDDSPNSTGGSFFRLRWEKFQTPLGIFCTLLGNIPILHWGILRLSGISSLMVDQLCLGRALLICS